MEVLPWETFMVNVGRFMWARSEEHHPHATLTDTMHSTFFRLTGEGRPSDRLGPRAAQILAYP